MPKDLELVGCGKTLELQHHRWIQRSDIAVPDVARHASEKYVGVTAFESANHREFGNGMPLPKILAQEKCVNARGVATHDDVLVIIGKNLRLDEIARAQQVRQSACFPNAAESASPEPFRITQVSTLQFFAREC